MDHWLVYWKKYWDEIDDPTQVTADWHSSYDNLFEDASPSDTFWVVISGGPSSTDEWRLLEKFKLQEKITLGDSPKSFRYKFIGDPDSHEVYDPDVGGDFSVVLSSLGFATDTPVKGFGRQVGQSLQSPRRLSGLDARKLQIYAEGLG